MHSLKILFSFFVLSVFVFSAGYITALADVQYSDSVSAAPAKPIDGIFNEFTYGTSNSWNHYLNNTFNSPVNSKIISGPWVLESWQSWHTNWLKKFQLAENKDKIPYMYVYTIAGKARLDQGLQDCNVGAVLTLCQYGTTYIRNNTNSLTQEYINTALNIKSLYGTTKPIMLEMEPDFWHFSGNKNQVNPLTYKEAWDLMNTWTSAIKNILPNARLVMDVSGWSTLNEIKAWSVGFRNFTYAGMVGRDFPISGVWGKTYSQIAEATGKQLIVDGAHGTGGEMLPYDRSWENRAALQTQVNGGVIAMLQPPSSNAEFTIYLTNYLKTPLIKI